VGGDKMELVRRVRTPSERTLSRKSTRPRPFTMDLALKGDAEVSPPRTVAPRGPDRTVCHTEVMMPMLAIVLTTSLTIAA
jgi:hypothetical protein